MNKNRTYTVLLLFLFTLSLKAQEVQGPYFVYYLLKNTSLSKTYSGFCQKNKSIQDSTAHGQFLLSGTKCDPTIKYTPDQNFIGRDTATYEYKEYYTSKIKYWSFVFIVVESYIELNGDYYSVDKNSSDYDAHPLSNDSSSIGSYEYLKIKNISASNNLIVSQPDDTTIRFRPETDFTGVAYISYTVCDTFSNCSDASLVVNVNDANNQKSDSLYVGTPKNTHVAIPLPIAGYTTYVSPKKGYLEYNSDYSVLYKPQTNLTGADTFVVVNNGIYRHVFIDIYYTKDPSKITVDDVVFTPKDSTVVFNVANNDITKKYPFLLDQGPDKGTLTKLDNLGNFEYKPEANYEGVQSFTYKVCPLGQCEYGEVKILIGNWQPDTRAHYKFSTPKNVPIVFGYHIPINAYNFSDSNPLDSVKFYPGFDTVVVYDSRNCPATVNGYNILTFSPFKNYADKKTITVDYCIPSTGECVQAICDVTIYDENPNCDLQCVGDCVWPGDVNMDGEVTMQDFLQVGYNLGRTGDSRQFKSTDIFRALKCNDWNGSISGSMANLKHADTNGDGTVSCSDTAYIHDFYRKQHSLVPKQVYDRGSFPFILNVLTPNVKIGDTAQIEIQLGDEANPVINLGGFSYELDYNTNVVKVPSLGVKFYQNGWATLNSALMHMYQKPWDGRLESGFVRSNGNKVSGKGGVEVLNFIVEDDIGGIRKGDEVLTVPFYFQNIMVMGDDGRYVQLPNQVAYIKIGNQDTKSTLDASALVVYPNPTDDFLNVHLNGKDNFILSMSLYSTDGTMLKEIKNPDQKNQRINVQYLSNGLYLLRTETTLGPISKKVEIFR